MRPFQFHWQKGRRSSWEWSTLVSSICGWETIGRVCWRQIRLSRKLCSERRPRCRTIVCLHQDSDASHMKIMDNALQKQCKHTSKSDLQNQSPRPIVVPVFCGLPQFALFYQRTLSPGINFISGWLWVWLGYSMDIFVASPIYQLTAKCVRPRFRNI